MAERITRDNTALSRVTNANFCRSNLAAIVRNSVLRNTVRNYQVIELAYVFLFVSVRYFHWHRRRRPMKTKTCAKSTSYLNNSRISHGSRPTLEDSGVITGLSPVPIDEKGYARQDLVMHRILIIMNNEDIAEGWPADDLQARRYVDAMRSPPPPAVLWGKIRNLKAARPRLQTG